MKFQYNDGGREAAGFQGKAGDCVARSIAIATEQPYQVVYDVLADGNANTRKTKRRCKTAGQRTASKGIYTSAKWFKDYMVNIGWTWVPTMLVGSGCKTHMRSEELPAGRIICRVSKHFTAVIDGIINDTHDCSRAGTRCVYGYYRLVK